MLLLRQIGILVWKNILITLVRHPVTTPLRAFILPVVFGWFLSYARNLFVPPSVYGIGTATPVRSLQDAFGAAGAGRDTVAFVNNGLSGGDIDTIIDQISSVATLEGKTVERLAEEDDLLTTCPSSLRGTSRCIVAIVFYSSPDEGPGGLWNYSIRADGELNSIVKVTQTNNDPEIYVLPIQHAVDYAIAGLNTTVNHGALPEVDEYPYTSVTPEQHTTNIRIRYMGGIISVLGVAFFIGICGILYQQVGAQAVEREIKMSQLLECMMPNKRRWEPQVARLLSYHFAFSLIFLPGWIVLAIILQRGVFTNTSLGVLLILNLLTGFSLASFSLFGAAFFKKAQLSGGSITIIALLLAVLAQVYTSVSTGAVVIFSLLFPPMNYTYFIILMARWESANLSTDLTRLAPDDPWKVKGIVLWIFLIIQILVYPILGALVERSLWGTTSGGRRLLSSGDSTATVELRGFTKRFAPSWLSRHTPSFVISLFRQKRKETVVAVEGLNLTVLPGQIMVLLGANGSGKSATLDAIAGLSTVTSGTIAVDFDNGLGFCPQQNVLWKELTVYEHVSIFNKLKSTGRPSSKSEKEELIRSCDLDRKIKAQAGSLSGGQMRKLQLSLMFIGGSRVCLIDECSSGVDALARRKLQDILLAERSRSNRTMIFTTHFLDEADFLSDYIVIMSKGSLKLEGTAPEIKHALGQYRVHLFHNTGNPSIPTFDGIEKKELYDQTIYLVSEPAQAADLLSKLEAQGFGDYQISGPTIEDAFMGVSEEMAQADEKPKPMPTPNPPSSDEGLSEDKGSHTDTSEKELRLQDGSRITAIRQGYILFRKRATVLRRNMLPNLAGFLVPIIAAGLVTLFIKDFQGAGCNPVDQVSASDISFLTTQFNYTLAIGPADRLSLESFRAIQSTLPAGNNLAAGGQGSNVSALISSIHMVNSLDEFNDYIQTNQTTLSPGGFYLGDAHSPPTFAYQGNGAVQYSVIIQNLMDTLLTNVSIATQYSSFDLPWSADTGNTLQLAVHLGLALAIYPAFYALYPCVERLRSVRALHYSNGVRALPLWLAYTTFDFCFILVSSAFVAIILRAASDVWYGLGYLFVVLFLYGLTALLGAYVVSLVAKSQLAAFAISAGSQAVMFLLYTIAYLTTLTYAPVDKIDSYLLIIHLVIAAFFPTASLIKSLFISMNIFSLICTGRNEIAPYPGAISLYGAPILYLIIQSMFLFFVLVMWDSGSALGGLFRRKTFRERDAEEKETPDNEIMEELSRVDTSTEDRLKVIHLTKAYGKLVAVEDVSFGVKRGECFALLGPNGAGKSTIISVIRGDLRPSNRDGEVLVENLSMTKRRAVARQHLGVCPQFDAMDRMTVREHLRFYAQIRGVKEVEHNVKEIIRAVGLEAFQTRMAISLSGGNKRKLSLGIALTGNPSVLLLDEPSSGMDVSAKRVMWRTLAAIIPGRSIVLTTHSMEEADALANRAGIMAKRMLALGTSDYLRKKHGNRYHVHLLMKSAPHTGAEEADRVRAWIADTFPSADMDEKAFHGQIRFSVPVGGARPASPVAGNREPSEDDVMAIESAAGAGKGGGVGGSEPGGGGVVGLFSALERSKGEMGFEYYSVSQTTLDQVFLSIVRKHNVEEENYELAGRDGRGSVGQRGGSASGNGGGAAAGSAGFRRRGWWKRS